MELKIPIEIVFDDVNGVIDELGKLQRYKLCEGDDMTLVDVDDVVDVLTRHVMAREAKEPCGTKEEWIPCSEKPPKKNGDYLVTGKHGAVNKRKYEDGRWYGGWDVIAWRELPEPYRGENDEL